MEMVRLKCRTVSTAGQGAMEAICLMSRECCSLDWKTGIPLLLHYRAVTFCHNFCPIDFAGFAWSWLKSEEKLMLSSAWKMVFTGAALFCTVVTAARGGLRTTPDVLIFLQMYPKVLVKPCLRLWDRGFQGRAAR